MAIKFITLEEALDLLDLPSSTDENEVRIEFEKFNFINRTQYIINWI